MANDNLKKVRSTNNYSTLGWIVKMNRIYYMSKMSFWNPKPLLRKFPDQRNLYLVSKAITLKAIIMMMTIVAILDILVELKEGVRWYKSEDYLREEND